MAIPLTGCDVLRRQQSEKGQCGQELFQGVRYTEGAEENAGESLNQEARPTGQGFARDTDLAGTRPLRRSISGASALRPRNMEEEDVVRSR